MRITIPVVVDVDVQSWAGEYSLPPEAVPADALKHLRLHVSEVVAARGRQLGDLFAVHNVTSELDTEWASPPCAPAPTRSGATRRVRDFLDAYEEGTSGDRSEVYRYNDRKLSVADLRALLS